jgi:hypothetical protein
MTIVVEGKGTLCYMATRGIKERTAKKSLNKTYFFRNRKLSLNFEITFISTIEK